MRKRMYEHDKGCFFIEDITMIQIYSSNDNTAYVAVTTDRGNAKIDFPSETEAVTCLKEIRSLMNEYQSFLEAAGKEFEKRIEREYKFHNVSDSPKLEVKD